MVARTHPQRLATMFVMCPLVGGFSRRPSVCSSSWISNISPPFGAVAKRRNRPYCP